MQVSDLINCGVYVFTSDIFKAIEGVYNQMREETCEFFTITLSQETCFVFFFFDSY